MKPLINKLLEHEFKPFIELSIPVQGTNRDINLVTLSVLYSQSAPTLKFKSISTYNSIGHCLSDCPSFCVFYRIFRIVEGETKTGY